MISALVVIPTFVGFGAFPGGMSQLEIVKQIISSEDSDNDAKAVAEKAFPNTDGEEEEPTALLEALRGNETRRQQAQENLERYGPTRPARKSIREKLLNHLRPPEGEEKSKSHI